MPKDSKDVINQVSKYKFCTKLYDSLTICRDIILSKQKEKAIPIVYMVVTDAKSNSDAAFQISSMLEYLSETSSDLSEIYGESISNQLKDIKDVDNYYVDNCKTIDFTLSQINKARDIHFR